MLVALLRMRPPAGISTFLAGSGGGPTVLSADQCERVGLRIAPMPDAIRQRLLQFVPIAGTMVRNPFDANGLNAIVVQESVSASVDALEILRYPWEKVIKRGDSGWGDLMAALGDWPGLDMAIFHCPVDNNPMPVTEAMIAAMIGPVTAAAQLCRLPAAMVIHFTTNETSRRLSYNAQQVCHEKGIPLFTSVSGAALAIRRLMEFNRTHPGMLSGSTSWLRKSEALSAARSDALWSGVLTHAIGRGYTTTARTIRMQQLSSRLVDWLRDKAREAGAKGAVVGMSGGIDSSVVAVLCKRAFPDTCWACSFPVTASPKTWSMLDLVAKKFGIPTETVSIDAVYDALVSVLPTDGSPSKEAGRGQPEAEVEDGRHLLLCQPAELPGGGFEQSLRTGHRLLHASTAMAAWMSCRWVTW